MSIVSLGFHTFMERFEQERLEQLLDKARQVGLGKSSSSHGVITKWVVFTGTYSVGKTTLVQDLAKSLQVGFHQEPARKFIEDQLQLGRTRAEIWADVEPTVMPVHKLRVDLESSLNPSEPILLDTAIPDTLPYALLYETDPEEIIKASNLFRYKEPVFLVEPLPFKSDDVRNANAQERLALHYLRKEIYISLSYQVVSVPAFDRVGRRDFVLRCLDKIPDKM